jgi:5-methylcytosine-specific restriction protein A
MTERQVRCIDCRELALPGKSRCREHSRPGWRQRPPANRYAYGSGRAKTARQVLERDGFRCQLRYPDICIGRASQADHIVQPAAGGRNDLANLRAVCRPCHARRSGRQGAVAKRRAAERNHRGMEGR